MVEIIIPLRAVSENDVAGRDKCFSIIQNEYTKSYLKALGVEATAGNRSLQKLVARHAPLAKCSITSAWGDCPVIADTLRIVPKTLGRAASAPDVPRSGVRREIDDSQLTDLIGSVRLMSCVPPQTGASASLPEILHHQRAPAAIGTDFLAGREWGSLFEGGDSRPPKDIALSEELERMRMSARQASSAKRVVNADGVVQGNVQIDDQARRAREAREALARESFDCLKQKYILPFACEQVAGAGNLLAPWQVCALGEAPLEVSGPLLEQARAPISVTLEEIRQDAERLADGGLLLHRLTSCSHAMAKVPVASAEAVRLTGLLTHFLYWRLLGHLHSEANRLQERQRVSLLLTIQEQWSCLTAAYSESPVGVGFVIPVLLLSLKLAIEGIFSSRYPMLFEDPQPGSQLVAAINIVCMQLLDPDCAFARFAALDAEMPSRTLRLWRRYESVLSSKGLGSASRMLTRVNRTTPLVHSFVSDGAEPAHPETRRLLAKSASETMLKRRSGLALDKPLAHAQRSALHSVVSRQMDRTRSRDRASRQRRGLCPAASSNSIAQETKRPSSVGAT